MRAFAAILLLFCVSAMAASTTYRAGSKVLSIGDSSARVSESMGQPTRIEPITNEFGKKLGELWIYEIGAKVVTFQISAGRVEWIEESR